MPSRRSTHHDRPNGTNSFRCRICRGVHALRKCQRFMRFTAEKRLRAVLVNKYCPNCLAHQHSGQSCRSAGKCKVCDKDHHTLLHFKDVRPSRRQERNAGARSSTHGPRSPTGPPQTSTPHPIHTSLATLLQHNAVSVLPTALVKLDIGEKRFDIRVLIDPCSPTSRIATSLATAFGLSVTRVGAEGVCTVILRSPVTEFNREILLHLDPKLECHTPLRTISTDADQFRSIVLADGRWKHPSKIFLALGADVYPHVMLNGVVPSANGLPMAQNSVFGWILSGTCAQ